MLSALKNYAITFLIAALIFGLIAFFVVQIIVDSLSSSFIIDGTKNPVDTSQNSPTQPPVTDPVDPLNGSSFNILLVGVDYSPKLFVNYDPDLADQLTPETTAPETEEHTTEAPDIIAPPAEITVVDETTAAPDTGMLMPDGSLYFEGGFASGKYRNIGADTVMLLRVDKECRQFTFTAFPPEMVLSIENRDVLLRDLLVEYDLDFLCRKINAMTGILIDRYAVVNIDQFPEIVDILGGITYNVPCTMRYDDFNGHLHINLAPGLQELDGEHALHMLRFNKYSDPNQSRIKTAVGFVRAMLQKMTNLTYLPKAPE
ncbi:MAG: LCP family protein, partial [Clostridia bacterium]|nr:LCP family protein [Clostridia bacterium]